MRGRPQRRVKAGGPAQAAISRRKALPHRPSGAAGRLSAASSHRPRRRLAPHHLTFPPVWGILNIQRGPTVIRQSVLAVQLYLTLTARVPSGRSTNFPGKAEQDQNDPCQTREKSQDLRPTLPPISITSFFKEVTGRLYVTATLFGPFPDSCRIAQGKILVKFSLLLAKSPTVCYHKLNHENLRREQGNKRPTRRLVSMLIFVRVYSSNS